MYFLSLFCITDIGYKFAVANPAWASVGINTCLFYVWEEAFALHWDNNTPMSSSLAKFIRITEI